MERVPVVNLRRFGKRLSISLDRRTRRRCDFLFLKKPYKHRPGEYEQVFWQTQKGLKERRPRARFTIYGTATLHVLIDTNERYPWRFTGSQVERRSLPVGDYALWAQEQIAAVVERKTFENLLRELSDLRVLHQKLGELATFPNPALVVEANYADFLKPEKTRPLGARYCTRALAEVAVLHPALPVVYAGARKLANAWTHAFFQAVAGHGRDRPLPQVQEAAAKYAASSTARGGLALRIRKAILEDLPPSFPIGLLREHFPEAPDELLRRVLHELRTEGRLRCEGRGRSARWTKLF